MNSKKYPAEIAGTNTASLESSCWLFPQLALASGLLGLCGRYYLFSPQWIILDYHYAVGKYLNFDEGVAGRLYSVNNSRYHQYVELSILDPTVFYG